MLAFVLSLYGAAEPVFRHNSAHLHSSTTTSSNTKPIFSPEILSASIKALRSQKFSVVGQTTKPHFIYLQGVSFRRWMQECSL